jgi:hypothetical protein
MPPDTFSEFSQPETQMLSWLAVFLLLKAFHFNTYLFEFAVGANLYLPTPDQINLEYLFLPG